MPNEWLILAGALIVCLVVNMVLLVQNSRNACQFDPPSRYLSGGGTESMLRWDRTAGSIGLKGISTKNIFINDWQQWIDKYIVGYASKGGNLQNAAKYNFMAQNIDLRIWYVYNKEAKSVHVTKAQVSFQFGLKLVEVYSGLIAKFSIKYNNRTYRAGEFIHMQTYENVNIYGQIKACKDHQDLPQQLLNISVDQTLVYEAGTSSAGEQGLQVESVLIQRLEGPRVQDQMRILRNDAPTFTINPEIFIERQLQVEDKALTFTYNDT